MGAAVGDLVGDDRCHVVGGAVQAGPVLLGAGTEPRKVRGEHLVVAEGPHLRVPRPVRHVAAVQEHDGPGGPAVAAGTRWRMEFGVAARVARTCGFGRDGRGRRCGRGMGLGAGVRNGRTDLPWRLGGARGLFLGRGLLLVFRGSCLRLAVGPNRCRFVGWLRSAVFGVLGPGVFGVVCRGGFLDLDALPSLPTGAGSVVPSDSERSTNSSSVPASPPEPFWCWLMAGTPSRLRAIQAQRQRAGFRCQGLRPSGSFGGPLLRACQCPHAACGR